MHLSWCLHFKGQNIPLDHRIVSIICKLQVPAFSRLQMGANVLSFQVTNYPRFLGAHIFLDGHKDRFHCSFVNTFLCALKILTMSYCMMCA